MDGCLSFFHFPCKNNDVLWYSWWFRNPVDNHCLRWWKKPVVNHGISTTNLNWWVYWISEPSSQQQRGFGANPPRFRFQPQPPEPQTIFGEWLSHRTNPLEKGMEKTCGCVLLLQMFAGLFVLLVVCFYRLLFFCLKMKGLLHMISRCETALYTW